MSWKKLELSQPKPERSYYQHRPAVHLCGDLPISPYGLYRVLVFSQNSGFSVQEVLELLRRAVAPRELSYQYFHEGGEPDMERDKGATFTFYVDSYKLATRLQQQAHRPPIVGVRVSERPPLVVVDDAFRWRLRKVMLSRYDADERCLDLSRLYADERWQGEFCALQQFECLAAAVDVMKQELPQVRRLLLDHNHLSHLGSFRGIERRLPRLRSISLQNNNLTTLRTLRVFRGLHLVELWLKRNPLPGNYMQQLLIMFPGLRTFDGQSVRRSHALPAVCFSFRQEVSDSDGDSDLELVTVTDPKPLALPESRATYLAPSTPMKLGIRKLVRRFLKAFDSENRTRDLSSFYREKALVSLRLAEENSSLGSWAKPYASFSKQLLSSRNAVLTMFATWPKTSHLESTMTLDLTLVEACMLCVSITGSFAEHDWDGDYDGSGKVRHYMRSFVLTKSAQNSSEFLIANELIFLAEFGQGEQSPPPLSAKQRRLVSKLSAETRLKARWSSKFLKDTNWDYRQALLAFHTRLRRRQIPRKAFADAFQSGTSP